MAIIKTIFTFLLTALSVSYLAAQSPVKWRFEARDAGSGQYDLIFTADINEGWYTYSQFLESDDGPIPTSFSFKPNANYELVGKAEENGDRIEAYDKIFAMNLIKFKNKVTFTQRIKVSDRSKPIQGYVTWMVCDSEMCLAPKDQDFNISLLSATK
jgi:DsbC/DsbD-like thiol-disulfide interchange protein